MISLILCKVSQPSHQKQKSYDETFVTAKCAHINYGATLRANGGKYRENQISSKNLNFGLYHPNNHSGDLFQEMTLRNL